MAIIYSYPTVIPTKTDLILGTDVSTTNKSTKNFTVQSIIDLVTIATGDLQTVLDLGDTAVGKDIVLGTIGVPSNTMHAGVFTTGPGLAVISNDTAIGFSNVTSTDFTGNLTGVVKAGSSIEGTVTGVTQNQGDDSTKLATTAYVDNQVDPSVLQYLGDATGPFDLNLVTDDFKISGTANQIETTATTVVGSVGTVTLKFPTAGVTLPDGSGATTQAAADNTTKVATDAFVQQENNAQDLDFTDGTTASTVLLNSQTLTLEGTANQVTTTVSAQKVKFSLPATVIRNLQGNVTGTILATSSIQGVAGAGSTDAQNVLAVTQAAGDDSTRIATTAYVDTAAGSKTLSYQADAAGTGTMPFTMNLSTDDLDIAGGTNINTSTLAVTAGADPKAVITVNLDDSVTISGTSKADTFTTTAGTATWATTVLAGFTAITSDLFTGPLVGNADTATALASSGALSFGGEVTLSSSSPSPATYTSGGNITLNLGLNNAAVTGKILTGLVIPASGSSVVPSDTILSGIGKLQAQVNTGATGLRFMGSWNASMDTGGTDNTPDGTPALTSGGGLATSGTNTSVNTPVDNKLIDSSATFTSTVTASDRVYNEAGAFTTITSIDSDTELTLVDAIFLTTGQAYTIDNDPALSQGEYYVVSAVGASEARNATLNTIQNWQVGDWVIAGASNVWERLDQTSIEGAGTAGRIAKFSETSAIADSIILEDSDGIKLDSGKTLETQGTGGSLTVGGAATISGLTTAGAALSLTGGITLPVGTYGTVGQVLTNDASPGATTDLIWTTPTTGTVESVTAGVGIVLTGDAVDPVVNIDYLGTDNAILSATDISTGSIATTDQIWFNDVNTGTVTNTVKYAPVSKLPFDSYDKWILRGDNYAAGTAATSQDVDSEEVMTVAGGTIIDTVVGATRKVTINHGDLTVTQTDSTGTPLTPVFGGDFDFVSSASGTSQGHMNTVVTKAVTIPDSTFTSTAKGLVPVGGTGTTKFLRQDGTFQVPSYATYSWELDTNNSGTTNTVSKNSVVDFLSGASTITISKSGLNVSMDQESGVVAAGTYENVTVDTYGRVTAGTSVSRPQKTVSKSLSIAQSWQDMFSLSSLFGGIISDIFVNKKIATTDGCAALAAYIAQAGVSGTWSGSADSQTADNLVYNTVIDTANGELEVRFLSYNPDNMNVGYRCQARVLNTQGSVVISVNYNESGGSSGGVTFTDLT